MSCQQVPTTPAFNPYPRSVQVGEFEVAIGGGIWVAIRAQADDVSNCTNRTPYPTLHLLREESIDRAVAVFPEADAIFERNIEVLEGLGPQGWADLDVGPRCPMHAQPSVNGQGEHA